MGLEKGGNISSFFPEDESYRELPSDETPRTDLESDALYSSSIGSGEEVVTENMTEPTELWEEIKELEAKKPEPTADFRKEVAGFQSAVLFPRAGISLHPTLSLDLRIPFRYVISVYGRYNKKGQSFHTDNHHLNPSINISRYGTCPP